MPDVTPTTESGRALAIAEKVLDVPYLDPDGDLAILARQVIRSQEAASKAVAEVLDRLRTATHVPATCYRTHTQPDEHRGVTGAVWLADIDRMVDALIASERKP